MRGTPYPSQPHTLIPHTLSSPHPHILTPSCLTHSHPLTLTHPHPLTLTHPHPVHPHTQAHPVHQSSFYPHVYSYLNTHTATDSLLLIATQEAIHYLPVPLDAHPKMSRPQPLPVGPLYDVSAVAYDPVNKTVLWFDRETQFLRRWLLNSLIHTHTHTQTHTHTYTHTQTHADTHAHTRMHTCTHTNAYTYIHSTPLHTFCALTQHNC